MYNAINVHGVLDAMFVNCNVVGLYADDAKLSWAAW